MVFSFLYLTAFIAWSRELMTEPWMRLAESSSGDALTTRFSSELNSVRSVFSVLASDIPFSLSIGLDMFSSFCRSTGVALSLTHARHFRISNVPSANTYSSSSGVSAPDATRHMSRPPEKPVAAESIMRPKRK